MWRWYVGCLTWRGQVDCRAGRPIPPVHPFLNGYGHRGTTIIRAHLLTIKVRHFGNEDANEMPLFNIKIPNKTNLVSNDGSLQCVCGGGGGVKQEGLGIAM